MTKRTKHEIVLLEVPVYEIYINKLGRVYYIMGCNTHDAKRRLDLIMKVIHNIDNSDYAAIIRKTLSGAEVVKFYHQPTIYDYPNQEWVCD